MAGHDDGESFFDDDDLDTLPHDALLELENNAIQFTQAQTQAIRLKAPPSSDYGDDFDDEDLDDAVVIDESRSTPVIIPSLNRYNSRPATEQEQFRQQRHATVSNPNLNLANRQPPNGPPKFNQPNRPPRQETTSRNGIVVAHRGSQPAAVPDLTSLQRQVEEVIIRGC